MSLGSATGNPRNKVALKPGHSLMDWIRLGNSGKDLAGTGGIHLNVTKAQLAEHNKPNDAWLSIRGKVYNVTSYMDFHPGGPEELMKGVGMDATKMFNEVHSWVNYESILQKCLVGSLRTTCEEDIAITSSLSPPSSPARPPSGKTKNSEKDVKKQTNKLCQVDWYQTLDSLTLVFYTKRPGPDVHVRVENEDMLRVRLVSQTQLLRPHAALGKLDRVDVSDAGKVMVRLKKKTPRMWSRVGIVEPADDGGGTAVVEEVAEWWEATVADVRQLTHDTRQIDVRLNGDVYNHVPVGKHVLVRTTIGGEVVVRPYTPVCSLAGLNIPPTGCIRLIVKHYPSGALSPWLTGLPAGASLEVSTPHGSFNGLDPDLGLTALLLLAAGTGLTPMVSVITSALRSHARLKVQLIFFNKTERDIIWREYLDQLTTEKPRFTALHVLSEPSAGWDGRTGRVSSQLLSEHLPVASVDVPVTHFVCVCGPTAFTQSTERCLKEDFGFTSSNYFCFLGQ